MTQATLPAIEEPSSRAQSWRRTAYRFRGSSELDPRTGLLTMPAFEEALVREFKRAERCSWGLGFVHLRVPSTTGDPGAVMHIAGAWIRSALRAGDPVAVRSSDSFCLLIPDITGQELDDLCHRLQHGLESNPALPSNSHVETRGVVALPDRNQCCLERYLQAIDRILSNPGKMEAPTTSLLTPADERRLVEVRRRRLSAWLEREGAVDRSVLRESAADGEAGTYSMGRLVRRLGWLSPRRIHRILHQQKLTHRTFGEVALAIGYLRPHQILGLLALQQENPETLLDVLNQKGRLDDQTARRLLEGYFQYLRLADLEVLDMRPQ